MRYTLITLSCLTLLSACFAPKLPDPESRGARLYIEKCSSCHQAIQPKEFHLYQWERLFTMMERRLHHQEMKQPVTAEEKKAILDYLGQHARPEEEIQEELQLKEQQKQEQYQYQ